MKKTRYVLKEKYKNILDSLQVYFICILSALYITIISFTLYFLYYDILLLLHLIISFIYICILSAKISE